MQPTSMYGDHLELVKIATKCNLMMLNLLNFCGAYPHTSYKMVQIISFDLLEIMQFLKSLSDLSRGSLKWLETSFHAEISPLYHISLTITDVLSGIANLTIDY